MHVCIDLQEGFSCTLIYGILHGNLHASHTLHLFPPTPLLSDTDVLSVIPPAPSFLEINAHLSHLLLTNHLLGGDVERVYFRVHSTFGAAYAAPNVE